MNGLLPGQLVLPTNPGNPELLSFEDFDANVVPGHRPYRSDKIAHIIRIERKLQGLRPHQESGFQHLSPIDPRQNRAIFRES